REVEAVAARLELGPVERALPRLEREPPARGTAPGRPILAVLVEEQLDAPVGRRLERLGPAGCGATVAAGLLLPALEGLALLAVAPALENRPDEREQLRRIRVRLSVGPAGHRRLDLGGQQGRGLAARLL